ncbi:hypothetical protein [Actinokineospora terrae]|uniref:Uncharacterized protein n=1 Tax=Actinokineospora terrae TaxID=155974 RepID=A0A1H9X295_9PSEU|nr:hypothetical protein [Actinokineospora terrae]SES40007.1 hypothetical protein SAMN04487818_112141 [Actinokineospora terrae]
MNQVQQQAPPPEPLGRWTAGVGSFADLAGISLLYSVGWLGGIIGGAVGTLLGVVRLVQLRGRPLGTSIIAPVAVIAVGCGALALSASHYIAPEQAAANVTAPVTSTQPPPTSSTPPSDLAGGTSTTVDTPAPDAASTPEPFYSGQIRLTLEQGVNLDSGPRKVTDATGPSGAIDLYFGRSTSTLYANGGDLFSDSGPDKDAYTDCRKLLKDQTAGSSYAIALAGQKYCFLTSEKNLAWIRVNEANTVGGAATDNVVVDIKLWTRSQT